MQALCLNVRRTVGYKSPCLPNSDLDFLSPPHRPVATASNAPRRHFWRFVWLFVTRDDPNRNHKSAVRFHVVFRLPPRLRPLPSPFPTLPDYAPAKNQSPNADDIIAGQFALPFVLLQSIAYRNHTLDPPTVCLFANRNAIQLRQPRFHATALCRCLHDNRACATHRRLNQATAPRHHDSNTHEYEYPVVLYPRLDGLDHGVQNNPQCRLSHASRQIGYGEFLGSYR